MKKFIESMRIANGRAALVELHQRRFDLTRLAHFGKLAPIDLDAEVTAFLAAQPPHFLTALCKLRITFGRDLEKIEIDLYARRRVAAIALVDAPGLDYRFKYADRSALDTLRGQVPAGAEPIIVQNGLVTDGIYTNVCVFDGARWLTPERPLLGGVARAAAMAAGEITPAPILARDVEQGRYTKLRLVNCLNWFAEAHDVPWSRTPRMA